MSSFLLLQQFPACLFRVILIVFVMGGWWSYSCCFVRCCLLDLFNIARSILVLLPSSLFSIHLVRVRVVHLYNSIDTIVAWKRLRFILLVKSDFYMARSVSSQGLQKTNYPLVLIFRNISLRKELFLFVCFPIWNMVVFIVRDLDVGWARAKTRVLRA